MHLKFVWLILDSYGFTDCLNEFTVEHDDF